MNFPDLFKDPRILLGSIDEQVNSLLPLVQPYIELAAIAPIFLALVTRRPITIIWTLLLATGIWVSPAISGNSRTFFSILGIAGAFLVVGSGFAKRRSQRTVQARLIELQMRVAQLENNEERRLLRSLVSSDELADDQKSPLGSSQAN
jgi:hypothetical protein